jgi:hypothetical protein
MSNSWSIDYLATRMSLRKRWQPGLFSTIHCDWIHINEAPRGVIYFNPCDKVTLISLKRDIRNILRAPWNAMNFHFLDSNGDPVLDSNSRPVTSQTCREWLTLNDTDHTRLNAAYNNKPSVFLQSYPTWGSGDDTFSFNFWQAYHNSEVAGVNVSKNLTFDLQFRILTFKTPEDDLTEEVEEPNAYPSGREFFSTNQDWRTYGMTCTTGNDDLNEPFYSGQYQYHVDCDSDTFDTEVDNMAHLLHIAFTKGIEVPFNLSHLPHEKGYERIKLVAEITIRINNIFTSFYNPTMTLRVNPDQYLDQLTVQTLDFSVLQATHAGKLNSTSCLQRLGAPKNSLTMPSELYQRVTQLYDIVREVDQNFHATENWSLKAHADIREQLSEIMTQANEMMNLLSYNDNQFYHLSECLLIAQDVHDNTESLVIELGKRALLPNTSTYALTDTLSNLNFVELDKDFPLLYNEDILSKPRPLHKYALQDHNNKVQHEHNRLRDARESRIHIDVIIILSVILGLIVLAFIYYKFATWRK